MISENRGRDAIVDHVRAAVAAAGSRPFLIGIAGSVAVGKTSIAEALRSQLEPEHVTTVIGTDGFLFSNAQLNASGLMARKGFPESYDGERLAQFLVDVRAGDAKARAPRYSHEIYDVLDTEIGVGHAHIVIVEGVNALQFAQHYHVAIYVEADEAHIEQWYVERFVQLCVAACSDETSFFRRFVTNSETEQRAVAKMLWDTINAVNLRDHIVPTMASADVVLRKAADHTIERVLFRAHPA